MLLLRLRQGITSGCHHVTLHQIFFWFIHYCGKGALCFCFDLAKYFVRVTPCHPFTKNVLDYSLLWEGSIMLLLRLSQVFRQGATMPPLLPIFRFSIAARGIFLLLRHSQGMSSGCHHATPTPIFFICHYGGKEAFSFCFDLDRIIFQGANMPPLHIIFINNYCGKGHYASAST